MLERFENDLKVALKSREKRRVSTLRLLLSALKNERIQRQRELSEEEVEAVLRRAVKQRKEAIEQFDRGGRTDLAEAEQEELAVLEAYLPKGLSDTEIEDALRSIIAEKGFSSSRDVGLLMKEAMARFRGRIDGKRAQEAARRLLP